MLNTGSRLSFRHRLDPRRRHAPTLRRDDHKAAFHTNLYAHSAIHLFHAIALRFWLQIDALGGLVGLAEDAA